MPTSMRGGDEESIIGPDGPAMKKLDFHREFLAMPDAMRARSQLYNITREPHISGTEGDLRVAQIVKAKFEEYGLPKVEWSMYDVLLTYPIDASVRMLSASGETLYDANLYEDAFEEEDPDTAHPNITPLYAGYSANGNVTAPLVYVNYGRTADFNYLKSRGVSVQGNIALIRYGGVNRADKVLNAQMNGAIGVIVYSDPEDYGSTTTTWNGFEGVYPDGPSLPGSGGQRGTYGFVPGDPLTPGWPSPKPGMRAEQVPIDDPRTKLPVIPVQPIGYDAAQPLLCNLTGPSDLPDDWIGGFASSCYRLGSAPSGDDDAAEADDSEVLVNLFVNNNRTVTTIYNIIGTIEGEEEPDRYVLFGNHRDAWVFGAVDPNSGTSVMLEMINGYGKLLERGWRPRRSIVFASWDAEEQGLRGSTEWAEDNQATLISRAVSYFNLDSAASSTRFSVSAVPSLDNLVYASAKQCDDPLAEHSDLLTAWVAQVFRGDARALRAAVDSGRSIDELLDIGLVSALPPAVSRPGGEGTDYAAYLHHLGIPIANAGFGGDENRTTTSYPVYHSVYDDFRWVDLFGDPGFEHHRVMAQFYGTMVLRMADDAILPFDYRDYAREISKELVILNATLSESGFPLDITPMVGATRKLSAAADDIEWEKVTATSFADRRRINDRLMLAERGFLMEEGFDASFEPPWRQWVRHAVYGPTIDDQYSTTIFPDLRDAIGAAAAGAASWGDATHEMWRAARAISDAAKILSGRLRVGLKPAADSIDTSLTMPKPSAMIGSDNALDFSPPSSSSSLTASEIRRGFHDAFLAVPTNASAAAHLYALTRTPHMLGTEGGRDVAMFMYERLLEYLPPSTGAEVSLPTYEVLCTYPVSSVVEMTSPVSFRASLEEAAFDEDPDTSNPDNTPLFAGYSASGNVTAPLVYVNYGRSEDYDMLAEMGVSVEGKIVVARYGGIFRGNKCRNGEERGAVGCLVFSDPLDYGEMAGAYEGFEGAYPDGPNLPPSGAQRGSFFTGTAGDPVTPGWPSAAIEEDSALGHRFGDDVSEKIDIDDPRSLMPRIPAQPLSAADVTPLLCAMGGPAAPASWVGGITAPVSGEPCYTLGDNAIVRLEVNVTNAPGPAYNVVARIPGAIEPDRYGTSYFFSYTTPPIPPPRVIALFSPRLIALTFSLHYSSLSTDDDVPSF